MEVVRVIALALAGISAGFDIRTRRIPNALTFGGAGAAMVYQAWIGGLHGLGQSVAGWAVGILLFLPMFLMRGMGAGDVKLLGAVGAWLGAMGAVWTGLFSVFAGGLLAIAVGVRHRYLRQAFTNLWGMLAFWRAAGLRPLPGLTIEDAVGPRLPYGVAIAVGTAAAVFLK